MTNQAGRSARAQAERLRNTRPSISVGRRLIYAVLGVGGGWFIGTGIQHTSGAILGALGGLMVGVVIPIVLASRKRPRQSGDTDEAGRWAAGAAGEEATARILAPLSGRGWTILHDRAIPRSRANLDHLLIGPGGQVVVVDSKRWSTRNRATVHRAGGRLHCGPYDRHKSVETIGWATRRVNEELGVRALSVIVVHGAPVVGGTLRIGDVIVLGSEKLRPKMQGLSAAGPAAGLASRAEARFPPYGQ